MQTTLTPDVSAYLVYNPEFISTDSPDGLWFCTGAEDVACIKINAVCLPSGGTAQNLISSRSFIEAFKYILVVGADERKRKALADTIRTAIPSAEICITAQSAYKGCSSVVELNGKYGISAVENLWQDADEIPPYGLLEISSVEQVDLAKQPHAKSGIPALDKMIGGLYDGELSIWTGKRKEGKSTLLGLPILSGIREGRRVFVYSGELPDWRYKAWLQAMAAGPANLVEDTTDTEKHVWIPTQETARTIDLWWKDKLFLVDNRADGVHRPETLLSIMRHAWKRYGCSVFVLDNLMTVSLPGENKYDAQSAFVGQLVDFAHETRAHVHLVAHRRKGGADRKSKGDNDDVSGSGDITNRADNIFGVSRVTDDESPFDATLEVMGNRDYGETGIINLKFDIRSRRYYTQNLNWKCGWETPPHQVTFTELPGQQPDNPFVGG